MIFKKKAVQITVVDKPKKGTDSTTEETKLLDPETVKAIAEHGIEFVKATALIAVGLYAAIKAIDTASQIAVKKTKSADNEK